MKSSPWQRSTAFFIIVTLFLVSVADSLFYDEPIGWTIGCYQYLLLVVILLQMRLRYLGTSAKVLGVALLGLVVASLYEPGLLVVILGIFGTITLALVSRNGWTKDASLWFYLWLCFFPDGFARIFQDLGIILRRRSARRKRKSRIAEAFRNWAIPLIVGFIFVSLFSVANPIIENWIESFQNEIWNVLERFLKTFTLSRMFLWFIFTVSVWALLRTKVRRRKKIRTSEEEVLPLVEKLSQTSVAARTLVVCNAVFAVQTILDISYLWGGRALPEGMTYAEYAHRGAYPLLATALLAGLFVLIAFRPHGAAQRSGAARRLVYAWIGQNIFLMFSAVWRLLLYVEVYSLTRWRIAAAIWIGLVALGFVWICWRIIANKSNAWLLRMTFLSTVSVLYCCAFVNFDSYIAWFNVKHCEEVSGTGSAVDLDYIKSLGPESLPALDWLGRKLPYRGVGKKAIQYQVHLEIALARQLKNWRAWSILRYRLQQKYLQ